MYKNLTLLDSDDVAENQNVDLLVARLDSSNSVYSIVSRGTLESSPVQDFPDRFNDVDSICSFDGLFCYSKRCDDEDLFVLWNPATAESKNLPEIHIPNLLDQWTKTIGFGLDAQNNDYKIVRIMGNKCRENPTDEVMREGTDAYVYSLRGGNSWRKSGQVPSVEIFPFECLGLRLTAYKDGTFYWLCKTEEADRSRYYNHGSGVMILSFDMATEVFNAIPIGCPPGDQPTFCSIFWLKESIPSVMLEYEQHWQSDRAYQIWAQLQPGVAESWTKLYTIDWMSGLSTPLGFWRNEIIFQTFSGQLLMCEPSQQETKTIQIDTLESPLIYESLEELARDAYMFPYKASHINLL